VPLHGIKIKNEMYFLIYLTMIRRKM